MEDKIYKQNSFYQTKMNEAKLGAYYTDLEHCKWISQIVEFPEDEEVCCLEPAIGDGEAIMIITGKRDTPQSKIKIYGVELNRNTYLSILNNNGINQCIHADFLTDVLISHHSFSFVFANPPYGTIKGINGDFREEHEFLLKMEPYLTADAVIVYVIPQYVCADKHFLHDWCSFFDTNYIFKFHEREYNKYKQVVLIGRKKEKKEMVSEEVENIHKTVSTPENIPLLPEKFQGEKVKIMKSAEQNISQFQTLNFHWEEAAECLLKSPMNEMVRNKLKVPEYLLNNLARPPIMPSAGHMYLLAISGAGQGLVGNEEKRDIHLQRGASKMVLKSEYVQDEDGEMKLIETRHPQLYYNIIESNGKITTLK